jgi:ribose transport system permease protein
MRSPSLGRSSYGKTSFTLPAILVLGYVILAADSGGTLLTRQAVRGILAYLAVPVVIGLAQMVVLAIGQMNLAIGAMGGATCALMATLMSVHKIPVALALFIGLVFATMLGAINGILVVITRLNGFIITLGTMTILLGIQYRLVRSFTVDNYSSALQNFGQRNIMGIPYLFILALVAAVGLSLYFAKTASGRNLLATGGNSVAARLSGISNDRSTIKAHLISGLLVGIASCLSIASLSGINRSIGGDWLLPSFAAPIIGGVLLSGGTVAIFGTVMAAGVVRLVDVARAQYSLDPSWVNFVLGIIVLSTVALSEWRERRADIKRITVTA